MCACVSRYVWSVVQPPLLQVWSSYGWCCLRARCIYQFPNPLLSETHIGWHLPFMLAGMNPRILFFKLFRDSQNCRHKNIFFFFFPLFWVVKGPIFKVPCKHGTLAFFDVTAFFVWEPPKKIKWSKKISCCCLWWGWTITAQMVM